MPVLANPKHERFAQEYLLDLVAGRAYERAGYAARGRVADAAASRMLADVNAGPVIWSRINELKQERAKRMAVSQDEVLAELVKIGFANMGDYMRVTFAGDPYLDLSGLTRDQTAAISEVTVDDYTDGRGDDARDVRKVKIKLIDKRSALVDIGKHLGMFVERHEHTVTEPISIIDFDRSEVDQVEVTPSTEDDAD